MTALSGFSKLTSQEKIQKLAEQGFLSDAILHRLVSFRPADSLFARLLENMTENVVSSFPLPYSIAPGFLINGREYAVPMVTEESSVIAAASWSARFWAERGGFRARVISETKIGQIHFTCDGDPAEIRKKARSIFSRLKKSVSTLTAGMEKRGGGIYGFELIDMTGLIAGLFQIRVDFGTADSMGANFINTCLEQMAGMLPDILSGLVSNQVQTDVILAILSNHTPGCRVECTVECSIDNLTGIRGVTDTSDFARRFELAVRIAQVDPYRAVTHNKGIYNGIDAVVLATANDSRAVEAAGHAYASRTGEYTSLTHISTDNNIFRYTLDVPMALGTVGGLTRLHPMAEASLEILGNPSAGELMQIAASAGLANNFAALKALVTTGIQAGHMPLHRRKKSLTQ